MLPQVSLKREGFRTVWTSMGLLSSVKYDMSLRVNWLCKNFCAVGTTKRFFACMYSKVSFPSVFFLMKLQRNYRVPGTNRKDFAKYEHLWGFVPECTAICRRKIVFGRMILYTGHNWKSFRQSLCQTSCKCSFSYASSVNISDRKRLCTIWPLFCVNSHVHSTEQKILNKDHINSVSLQHVMPHVVGGPGLWRIISNTGNTWRSCRTSLLDDFSHVSAAL